MNSLWVELGQVSTGGTGRVVGIALLLAVAAGLVGLALLGLRAKSTAVVGSSAVLGLPVLWGSTGSPSGEAWAEPAPSRRTAWCRTRPSCSFKTPNPSTTCG